MRLHTLPDAALTALGAGRPDPATVHLLRQAQLSKHLLMLREIVRAAPTTTKLWYDRLSAAQHTDPAGTRRLLADPLVGAWAADTLKSLRAGGSPAIPDRTSISGRRLTATHDGLTVDVRLEDTDPRRALLGLTPTGRLTDAGVAHWQRLLDDAWRILVSRHRKQAELLAAVLECVVPVEPDPAARGISATSADAFGAVAMSAPEDGTALAVALLHEAQHSLLNAVSYLFDLHRTPAALGYSPWRDDPRPMSGMLHGAYAYLAVTRFWRAEAPGSRLATFEFARWRTAVAEVADRLLGADDLTPAGARFVTALRDEVRPWLDEPVDAEITRLAAAANTDHRLRWRLRNLHVDPADAAAIADAWVRHEKPPDHAVRSHLMPAPRRALEHSARLDLIHRLLSGPERAGGGAARPGGRATAGDCAFLSGDHGTALDAYRKGVVQEPGDDAAWTGLALVSGHRDRLEIVAATYRSLPEKSDPLELARWLTSGGALPDR